MNQRKRLAFLVVPFLAICGGSAALAQLTTGTLSASIRAGQSAVIAGATASAD